jgi:RNA polymerase sigma-70 factor (ECF subfamily)
MTLDSDAELMRRLAEGDDSGFALLLARHHGSVVRYLYRMVQNYPVAEELAQDAFIRVFRSRASYQPSARFATWLFRIATNLALNWRRDERHEFTLVRLDEKPVFGGVIEIRDKRPTAEETHVRRLGACEVRAAVHALPAKQRAAVLMHKYEEMEYSQIASVLGCSVPAVKSLLFRAYEALRIRLAHLEPRSARTAAA